MRIGIDARMLGQSGIGRYIESLVRYVPKLDRRDEYYLFMRDSIKPLGPNIHIIKADIPWYSMQEQMKLVKIFQDTKLDLLHVPHFNVPLFYRDRFVVTIHDLTHTKVSMQRATTLSPWLYRAKRLAYQRVVEHAVHDSKKIITVSQAVRREIVSTYTVPADKVVVTHEAVEKRFCSITRARPIDEPYFFYVGNAHPHKNLERLLRAYSLVRQQKPHIKLVLAGKEHFFWQRLRDEARREGLVEGVLFVGGVSDEQLESYYQHAVSYVFPSLSEGFGLPILEALKCGTRVIASNIPALREVGGDLITYVDPYSEEKIAEAMVRHCKTVPSKSWRAQVAPHIRTFSWEDLAVKTLEVYREVLSL